MADLVAQQLNNDPLLQHVMQTIDGQPRPVVGGIPLLSKIGEGTTGAVYRAHHPSLNRDVAVKVMLFPDEKSIRFQKFMAHAQSAKKVKHKRLIEVIDAATQSGLVYVVCELFESISADKHLQKLKERLKPGLPETALLNMAISTAEALAAAHNEDVVHLDIRPSCLLIPKAANGDLAFGESKLGDLGQAYNEFVGRFLIGTPAETGMPGFMSPEQAMGIDNPSKASDVFSFGASIYALLVGQSPFGGLTIDNVISATLHQPIGDVRTWRPDVSRATSKIVEICLRKHPAARFSDARVLLQALQISLDSLDCGIDIQQAAVEEIDSLVKSHSSANLPAASIMPVTSALTDQLAQAAASHVTLPVLPPTPTTGVAARPSALAPVQPKPVDPVPPPPATDAASEPTLITSIPTQRPKKATELFNDLLKKPSGQEGQQVVPITPAASGKLPALPSSVGSTSGKLPALPPSTKTPGTRPVTKVIPLKSATPPAASEWVDPTVEQAELNTEPAKKKGGASGVLVAALLLVAVGAGAWKMGYLPIGKQTVVAQKKPAPKVDPATKNDPATKAGDPATKNDPVTKAGDPATKNDPVTKAGDPATITDDAAKKAEQEKLAAAEKEKAEQANIAAAKAEKEKLEAELAAKAEEERKLKEVADAAAAKLKEAEEAKAAAALKAKQEEERLAKEAEAAKKLKEEQEIAAAAALKAKAEEEQRLQKEAEAARLAKQKQEEEQRLAEAAAKAEKERLEKAALAAKQKEEEEAKRVKAEQLEAIKKAEAAIIAKEQEAKRIAEQKARAEQEKPVANTTTIKKGSLAKDLVVKLGNNVDVDFVLAEGGTFTMGTDRAKLTELAKAANADEKDFIDETPANKVDVPSFYISKTPITVAQFRRFVDATGYKTSAEKAGAAYTLRDREWKYTPGASWAKPGFSQRDDHPVVMLSWRDCDAFAKWASAESGRPVRLPTEAEWEYAARGVRSNVYPWGDSWDGRMANHGDRRLQPHAPSDWYTSRFDDGYPFTAPVEKFVNASWCGAMDMAGNVWQWCSDAYEPYPQSSSAPRIIESDVPADSKRVLRGGSWLLRGFECRAAARRGASPRSTSCEFGMRLALTPDAGK